MEVPTSMSTDVIIIWIVVIFTTTEFQIWLGLSFILGRQCVKLHLFQVTSGSLCCSLSATAPNHPLPHPKESIQYSTAYGLFAKRWNINEKEQREGKEAIQQVMFNCSKLARCLKFHSVHLNGFVFYSWKRDCILYL